MTGGGAALRVDGRAVDEESFYRVACDPHRSVVVEACAGAGKTWMLVSRILRALVDGVRPQEILAITFTRKAAAEVRDRLEEWLLAFSDLRSTPEVRRVELRKRGLHGAALDAAADRLGALYAEGLRDGSRVEIRTFHGWFGQLVRSAPWALLAEVGLGGEPVLFEEFDEHRRDVMRRFFQAVRQDARLRADLDALVAARGRSTVERWFDAVVARRVEIELALDVGSLGGSVADAASVDPVVMSSGDARDHLLVPAIEDLIRDLARTLAEGNAKKARDSAAKLDAALACRDRESRHQALRAALLTQKGEPFQHVNGPQAEAVLAQLARVDTALVQQQACDEHLAMTRLAERLLVTYRDYKRRRGLADLNDLERGALALLRDVPQAGWLHERLDLRVRQVLIDEFQDTNPLQWQAIRSWLEGYAGAGGGASGAAPPSVFLVGDPKQSIYRFRRAEPRVFAAAAEFVVDALGGQRLACDHTRRNHPLVLDAVNATFAPLNASGRFDGFRPHTTTIAAEPGGPLSVPDVPGARRLARVLRPPVDRAVRAPDAPLVFRDSLDEPRDREDEHLRLVEARQVATAIEELVSPPSGPRADPGSILVLARTRAPLRHLAQALRERGIPHAPADDLPLDEAPEVLDLLAVLDVLASPGQDLSLARALRSPLFGIDDADLLRVAEPVADGRAATWWASLMGLSSPGDALSRAQRLLTAWQAAAAELPPHDLLERIVGEGELRERLVAAVPAAARPLALAAVQGLIEASLRLDSARYATPYGLVRALRRQGVTMPAPRLAAAVQLMTVHGAKGLEADTVFVMDADAEAARADGPGVLVDWPVDAPAPRVCAFVSAASRIPPSLRDLFASELEARGREELNGLYVAMTRARRRLIVSATEPHRGAPASWWSCLQQPLPGPVDLDPTLALRGAEAPGDRPVLAAPTSASIERLPSGAFATPSRPASPPDPMLLPDDDVPRRRRAGTDTHRRLGLAVHRALEWAFGPSRSPSSANVAAELERACAAAASEFGVETHGVAVVVRRVRTAPELAPFFAPSGLHWAGNEVTLPLDGRVLRLDRLVQTRPTAARPAEWWVLDYKLEHEPQREAAYLQQLRDYRSAVQRLQPGEPVRCAFITARGELIEPALDG
jgi:ATP-dependent helicase/nuclease subunit A